MQQFLQFIILTFIYSSKCFGRPHAHHQELINCSSSLWFYLRFVVIAVLLFLVGPGPRKKINVNQNAKLTRCYEIRRRPALCLTFLEVKCTLVQALRLCTGRTAHRGSRGIALLFHYQRH